jgi:CBS domain-containing protein
MLTPLALLMNRNIQKIRSDAFLSEAARLMRDRKIGALLVEEGEEFVGIVSESDLVRRAMAEGQEPGKVKVREVMSQPIISLDIDRTAKDANDMMATRGIRHLAITDRGKIVGVLSVRDLVICFKNRL